MMTSLSLPSRCTRALTISTILLSESALSFAPSKKAPFAQTKSSFLGAVVRVKDSPTEPTVASFDPLGLSDVTTTTTFRDSESSNQRNKLVDGHGLGITSAVSALLSLGLVLPQNANAIQMPKELIMSSGSFDPKNFVPICGASDNFYRLLQGSTKAIVGPENFQEYGPLIASGLLRVRLELCVVESFFNEAVGPFIQQNGLSWVLPVHETVETFLAGTVFALATTFILVGSTKLLTVLFTYLDFLVGGPMRLLGGFAFDRARGRPVTLDVGIGPFKTRVIGPPKDDTNEKDGSADWTVDLDNTKPVDLAVIVVSGGVKAAGSAVGVRYWIVGFLLFLVSDAQCLPQQPHEAAVCFVSRSCCTRLLWNPNQSNKLLVLCLPACRSLHIYTYIYYIDPERSLGCYRSICWKIVGSLGNGVHWI